MKSILKSLYQYSRNKEIKDLIFGAFNKDYEVRASVALNPSTPASILEKLSNDEDYFVRMYVAKNKNTPKSTLEKLSNDEDYFVRYWTSKNPNFIDKKL